MTLLKNLNGWQRLWALLAILWAIPISAFTVTSLPKYSESEIKAQWANEKVDLFRKYHGQGKSFTEYRLQVFGSKSDDEIIYPERNRSKGFDPSLAVPADELEIINQKYESQLSQLANESRARTIGFAFLIWAIPLIAIYFLGVGVRWVYQGFRNSR